MKLEGVHHVTCITGRRAGERRVLREHARPAARQEDGQPGRPDRLPPLLCRRARRARAPTSRSSSTPACRSGRAGDGMVHRIVFRVGSEASLDFWAERVGGERDDRLARLRRPRRARARADRRRLGRPAARSRATPRFPEEHAIRGFAGVRAYASRPERSDAAARGARASSPAGRRAASSAAASTSTTRRRRAPGCTAPAPCTTSPGRRCPTTTKRGASGCIEAAALADAGRSTASTSSRSTSASRAASCSRSRRSGPGFTADEPLETLGESLSLPPNFEQYRAQVEQILTPLPNPRLDASQ